MEPEAELLSQHDIATVRILEERPEEKKNMNYLWTEENWTNLKKALANSRYPAVIGECDETCVELGKYPVPKKTVFNVLQRIDRKPITYENAFPMKKGALIL